MLVMVNLLLSLFYRYFRARETEQIHGALLDFLLDEHLFELVRQKFPRESAVTRPVFHRQQLLTLARRVLEVSPDYGADNPFESVEARHRLGSACLLMNDLLVSPDQSERLLRELEHDPALEELLTQWLPVSELMNPPDEVHSLVRAHQFIKIINDHFSAVVISSGEHLLDVFDRVNGISLDAHLALVYCIYAYYNTLEYGQVTSNLNSLKFVKSVIFSKMTVSDEQKERFFELNARTLSSLIDDFRVPVATLLSQYDFTPFRKYPLAYFGEDFLTCVDANFLIEKLGPGVYHSIANSLDKVDRELFFTTWGQAFQEYVNQLLSEVYPLGSGRFFPTPYFDQVKSAYEAFDGVIDCGDALIAMEYKGGFLSAGAKYSGQRDLLVAELDQKFGRARGAGVEQLVRKIEVVFNSERAARKTFAQLHVDAVRRVYPVLVVQDISLQIGLANWRLKRWFEEERASRSIDRDLVIRPLSLLTVENLERLLSYVEAGDFAFTDILDEYGLGTYQPHESFQDVLINFRKKRGIKSRPNERILHSYGELHESMKTLFSE